MFSFHLCIKLTRRDSLFCVCDIRSLLCVILSTWLVCESFVQDSLTALVQLHLHQQLGQIVAQEALLLRLQGCFIVIYRLCVTAALWQHCLKCLSLNERRQHKPWRSCESWPGLSQSCWLTHHLWGFSSEHSHTPRWLSQAEDKHMTRHALVNIIQED